MSSVTLHNVNKVYADGLHAVRGVSIEVADGELVVLVGPSGCGKSTTLRMIAGLEEITSGEVRIGERVVNGVAPGKRDIAMVFQNYALYPHMTARKNMAFGLRMRRTPKREIERRVGEAAALLGIEELLDRRPGQLSGGQRQRVAVGRAIVREPAVFLFDEPLSNLDAKLRGDMRTELAALHRRLGATMIYVTHDQVEAMTLGDRLVLMNEGVVQQVGPPLEVYRRPANRFVASFIGNPAMNLLEGRVEAGLFTAGQARCPAPRVPDGPAVLGVRPEDVTIGAVEGERLATARVAAVEPLGHETLVHCRLGDSEWIARIDAGAGAPPIGEAVALSADGDRVHYFAATASGERLGPVD
ncbi:sn-glycerol-3-phosphate ABC transporter ATP-binding protein UgpC [Botrimarina sp.]|uniref:ABC transporter ATP-binding protein n=1 Tax=Botrimarina sp. TaxID=2795802 RepID=UPI0032EE435B